MANITKQVAGGVSAYADMGFTATDFNSLASANTVVAATAKTNATNLDMEGQISFVITNGATTTTSGSSFVFYMLELNQDGTTYGSGAVSGAVIPAAHESLVSVNILSGRTSGQTLTGTSDWFPMPIGEFKFVAQNSTGGAMNATASATFKYRTRNINTNG